MKYTPQEDQKLLILHRTRSYSDIANILGKSIQSVKHRAKRLGLGPKNGLGSSKNAEILATIQNMAARYAVDTKTLVSRIVYLERKSRD